MRESGKLHRARCRGVIGLLVIEWPRLFRLRSAPGQQGAVITVGSFDFLDSALLADIYGSALAATAARHRLRSVTALRFRDPWRGAGRWLRAHGLSSEGGVGR